MNVLDLFSGIGGFSLGLERAGMRTVAFCEIDPYCRAVLRKHWPDVPCYDDIRTLTAERLRADGIAVDLICGGFPCQDISTAGKGAGIRGERSGLWSEYARIIGEVRPRYAIVENVSALLSRGLGVVLGDLAALGYDAEWHCIPAAAVGAPHRRDRIWIVAYPDSESEHAGAVDAEMGRASESLAYPRRFADESGRAGRESVGAAGEDQSAEKERQRLRVAPANGGQDVANAIGSGQPRSRQSIAPSDSAPLISRQTTDAFDGRFAGQWIVEPDVGRVAHGVPARVDRLRSLGNAVIPQIPEMIGRAVMEAVA